jgi:hypothetical protein
MCIVFVLELFVLEWWLWGSRGRWLIRRSSMLRRIAIALIQFGQVQAQSSTRMRLTENTAFMNLPADHSPRMWRHKTPAWVHLITPRSSSSLIHIFPYYWTRRISKMETLAPPLKLTHLFTLRCAVDPPMEIGNGPYGRRRCVPIMSDQCEDRTLMERLFQEGRILCKFKCFNVVNITSDMI